MNSEYNGVHLDQLRGRMSDADGYLEDCIIYVHSHDIDFLSIHDQ